MDIKKLLTGTIAGGVVLFLLGWLVYGMLLQNFMSHNPGQAGDLGRKEMDYLFLVAGNLAQGLLLTYVLLKSNQNSMMSGLVTAGIVGFLIALSVDCVMYGTTTIMSKKGLLADVLAFTAMNAIAGAVIGMVTAGKNNS
jgi:hypothetical protein